MSRISSWILTLFVCLMTAAGVAQGASLFGFGEEESAAPTSNQADFLPVDEAFHAYAWHQDGRLFVGIRNQPGYYLYRHRFGLESRRPGLTLGDPDIPPGKFKHDQYLGDVHVFYGRVVLSAALPKPPADSVGAIPVTLTFQGCADAGLCYPPEHWQLAAKAGGPPEAFTDASNEAQASPIASRAAPTADPFRPADSPDAKADAVPQADPVSPAATLEPPASATTPSEPAPASDASPISADGRFRALLSGGIGIATLGLFFLAGIGLTFTPCVLPMIPILTSIIVGQNAGRRRALGLSLSYVAGMTVTFTALGTLMGLFGASLNLQARLQSVWVLVPFALLFMLFAVAMFGGFDLRLPGGFGRHVDRWQDRLQRSGPPGLATAGALSVLVVSPCVSAPLAGALVFISSTGDVLGGALALLALGLGMGLPLVVVGTFGSQWLPRAGAWMNGVKSLFGVMLLAVAIWLVERLLPGPIVLLLWSALAIGSALAMGALRFDGAAPQGWRLVRLVAGWMLLFWGAALVWGAAQGGSDPLRPLTAATAGAGTDVTRPHFRTVTSLDALQAALQDARSDGRPAMVDVSADWCISCKVMEREVFPRPEIARRLAGFTLIRADVTDDAPASRTLLEHYGLFGPPGLLFFSRGKELRAARVQGEVDAIELADHLDAVQRQIAN